MSVNRAQSKANPLEDPNSDSNRYLAVHEILEKIYQPEGGAANGALELMARKKSNAVSFLESTTTTEKTARIRKNKKKKRKNPTAELKADKVFKHEMCECCSSKGHLDITPTNDDYDSDSDALEDDQEEYLSGLVYSLVQENLEKYYD